MMIPIVEMIDSFEGCIVHSAQDSIHNIERTFALTQTRHGINAAIQALGFAYLTAQTRLDALETEIAAGALTRPGGGAA